MTKSKDKSDIKILTAEDAATVVEESINPDDLNYTPRSWRGLKMFCCKMCAWDTVEGEEVFIDHWKKVHEPDPAPVQKKPVEILIEDRYGNVRKQLLGG